MAVDSDFGRRSQEEEEEVEQGINGLSSSRSWIRQRRLFSICLGFKATLHKSDNCFGTALPVGRKNSKKCESCSRRRSLRRQPSYSNIPQKARWEKSRHGWLVLLLVGKEGGFARGGGGGGLVFLDFNGRHYSSWSPGRAVTQVHFLSGLVSMRFDKKGKGRRAFLFVFPPIAKI